ncbi:MAG TPA: hypothetical protein DEB39_06125 [Planctomycetaceae bacterium]|nr:hypothetical protein [Planctomycetaceae bacterium]
MGDNTIQILAVIEDVKREIWEGDLIILRNKKGIAFRALKVCRWDDAVFGVDVLKYRGVTAVSLEQLICRHPGNIDVYEVNPQDRWPNYDRQRATRFLKSIVFSEEDCRVMFLKMLRNLFLKLFYPAIAKHDSVPCGAEAIRLADRHGGVEPVPDRANERISVSDLERSPFYRYRFTLK